MPLWKTKALNLTEAEVRYAMSVTKSNAQAARFIGCLVSTYKKYASRYYDVESGKTLYELHKNQQGVGISKAHTNEFNAVSIFDILEGKHPSYDRSKLGKRLIEECILPEECSVCKFSERRITDYKMPLLLIHKDGNLRNHVLENLEFVCYNCYFLTFDELFVKTSRVNFKGF